MGTIFYPYTFKVTGSNGLLNPEVMEYVFENNCQLVSDSIFGVETQCRWRMTVRKTNIARIVQRSLC